MPSSSREEEVCPSSHKKERVMAMVNFLLSSVESCRGDHRISSREEEVCLLSPKKERSTTMVIFLASLVESCRGDHGISSRGEEVCPATPKRERGITMVIFLLSLSRVLCRRSLHIFWRRGGLPFKFKSKFKRL